MQRPAKSHATGSSRPVEAPHSFAFGPFVLTPERQVLSKDGAPLRIGKRALELLSAFVQRPGDVVSKDELLSHAWPDQAVDEGNLKVNIAALRRALGDDSDQPRYIATVVGRGYRFIAPVLSSELPQAPQKLAHLPTGTARIFGRAATIASILQELETSRLVSVVGPGGIGKTTVALAVAHEAARSFEHGAWFVDLSTVEHAALVPEAVAEALGLAEPAALGQLRERSLLIVLDNCEHVIDAVARYAHQVVTHAKNVRLLATSRESLCIKEERVRRLPGLSTPPARTPLDAKAALDFAAVQLFVDRASLKSRSFALSDANAATVAEICRRLDGLALAIERIATRIDTLEVGKMLEHIDHRRHLLDEHPAGPERHRTVAATLDWSYALLSDNERAVLRRLAIFDGTFSLESACAVAAGDGVDPVALVEDVASLAAKSLLVTESRAGEVDYRQTNVVRAFSLNKLAESGELDRARRRHAEQSPPTVDTAEPSSRNNRPPQ